MDESLLSFLSYSKLSYPYGIPGEVLHSAKSRVLLTCNSVKSRKDSSFIVAFIIPDSEDTSSNIELIHAAAQKGMKLSEDEYKVNIINLNEFENNITNLKLNFVDLLLQQYKLYRYKIIMGYDLIKNHFLKHGVNFNDAVFKDTAIKDAVQFGILNPSNKLLFTYSASEVSNSQDIKKKFWGHIKNIKG